MKGVFGVTMAPSDFSLAVKSLPTVRDSCNAPYSLMMGCNKANMIFSRCEIKSEESTAQKCTTYWKEEKRVMMIARTTSYYVCYSFEEKKDQIFVSMRRNSCDHIPSFSFNMSKLRECSEASTGHSNSLTLLALIILLTR